MAGGNIYRAGANLKFGNNQGDVQISADDIVSSERHFFREKNKEKRRGEIYGQGRE